MKMAGKIGDLGKQEGAGKRFPVTICVTDRSERI